MRTIRYPKRLYSVANVSAPRVLRARRTRERSAHTRKKSLHRILQTLRAHLPALTEKYPIQSLGVFGSYVRDDATPSSDLDVLIELYDDARLGYAFIGIENELSKLLGIKVDLIEKKTLKPRILENVMREVVQV